MNKNTNRKWHTRRKSLNLLKNNELEQLKELLTIELSKEDKTKLEEVYTKFLSYKCKISNK